MIIDPPMRREARVLARYHQVQQERPASCLTARSAQDRVRGFLQVSGDRTREGSMRTNATMAALCAVTLAGAGFAARGDDDLPRLPQNPTFTTVSITPFAIEGLTGDGAGNLYTSGRAPVPAGATAGPRCPVW